MSSRSPRGKISSARLALGRANSEDRTSPAAPSSSSISRLKLPATPSPKQPMIYGGPPLFGRHSATALERLLPSKVGLALRISGQELVEQINDVEMPFWALNAALIERGRDSDFFLYAKAIAQHAAALGELLYGQPLTDLRPPGFVTVAAREALFHQGTPPGVDPESMLDATDAAGRGLAFLHHSAIHATERWADLVRSPKPYQGKPHVRALIRALAEIYYGAFKVTPLRQPSKSAPVVTFCLFVTGAMCRRMARQYGHPLPDALLELKALDAAKVSEHLRAPRRRA